MSSNKSPGPRALVEPLTLADNELSALTLANSTDHYSASELESFVSIEADLECMNEEVMTTEEIIIERPEDNQTIAPDVEMADLSEEVQSDQIIYSPSPQPSQNLVFQTKPTLQRVPISAVQVKPNAVQPTQSQSIMIVSPAGGSGTSQILKISHPATASRGQIQSLAQSIITAKSADGNIVHLRSAQTGKPLVATSQAANITVSNIQGAKNAQTTAKRPTQVIHQGRNVITKMFLSGSQSQPGQEVILAQSQDTPQSQTIKFLTTSNAQGLNNAAKTITFAQAQQMGLISAGNKVQQILPSGAQKQQGILLNKSGLVVQTSTSQPPKLTLIPTTSVKSPAKILPAPTVTTQVRQTSIPNSQVTFTNTGKSAVQTSPQKVIIRQSALKPGTVLGGGQVIRIPGHPIQMPGRQVQYVRLVSTASSPTTNVMTVGKPKPQTIQAMGVTQKIGGQQQIVKVVPLNTATNQPLRTVAPKTTVSGGNQRLLIPAPTTTGGQTKNAVAIPASALSQLASGQAVISTNSNVGNIVVLPAQYIQQQTEEPKPKSTPSTPTLLSSSQSTSGNLSSSSADPPTPKGSQKSSAAAEANGIRPRKPCNCTKSQCLKLYCDCFANGEFCHMCNCNNCSNNLGNEEERQRAIKTCLERNPNAFRPKIGKGRETGDDIRRHNKGCNCKRSGCLKNYCECYEAKIPCSANCKCIGCRNVEEPTIEKKSLKDLADAAEVRTTQLMLNKSKTQQFSAMTFRPPATSNTGPRQPFNFLTDKVVEMTCQCLMAQAEDAERSMLDEDTSQRLIIEEFGRCLKEIIESAYEAEATT
ncbi:protein lin-54 homolog [Diachasma alloeum]|uniref:protein lin-54 homolog n=1 Tax=Diachasma alloeum TaxID=454923 RepID=UPI0007383DAC|nr:protein lin-54 homolog [Diachasma alloeum]